MDIQKTQQYNTQSLIQDLRQIIEQARGQVAAHGQLCINHDVLAYR